MRFRLKKEHIGVLAYVILEIFPNYDPDGTRVLQHVWDKVLQCKAKLEDSGQKTITLEIQDADVISIEDIICDACRGRCSQILHNVIARNGQIPPDERSIMVETYHKCIRARKIVTRMGNSLRMRAYGQRAAA